MTTSSTSKPTVPDTHYDLLSAPVAVLATISSDGSPQVTATWFLLDDDGLLKMSLNTTRQKVKNLREHPQATVLILDPSNPYRTVEIRGKAEITPDPDYEFADKVGRKYGGTDFRELDQPGQSRVVVTLYPSKVNIWG